MANGNTRSTATQTSPPGVIKRGSSSRTRPSNSSIPTSSRVSTELNFAAETAESSAYDQTHPPAFLSNEAGRCSPRSDGHSQRLFFRDDDHVSMHDSPAASCNGSTNRDGTPRARPTDAALSPSPLSRQSNNTTSPIRQDSAYESTKGYQDEESKLDVDTQAANIRARERVAILRGRVLRTRHILNEKRQDVQLLREKLRDSTAQLMRAIDELVARDNVQNLRSLGPFYEATRKAQDELGPVEDAYDLWEIRLNREEDELEQEEMHFYTHNKIVLASLPDSKLDEPITPLIQPYQPDNGQFQDLDLENELVREYLGNLADAEHLKEEIDELENEQYMLMEELAFRTRYNLKLSKEKESFIFEYPQNHKDLVEKLQQMENNLFELRQRCIEQGLLTESEYTYEPRDELVEEIQDSLNDALDLLPLRLAADNAGHQHEPNFEDKRDYVNTWLLEWVQDSPIETLRLRICIDFEFDRDGKQMEVEKWPTLALDWWDRDRAGEDANEKHALSTMDALLGATSNSRESEGSLDVDLGDGERVEIEIMGSETGSYRTQKVYDRTRNTDDDEVPRENWIEQGLLVRKRTSSGSGAISV